MGAWGGGLYESDFARDLRATIEGVWKAPISDEEILAEIESAHSCDGDDHVDAFDYWLVLADQLERRGMPRKDIFDRAISIIDQGEDLKALEELDAEPRTLAKRRKVHGELVQRLRDPRPAKKRRPLSKPQPLLFTVGEAIAWPTDKGRLNEPWVAGGFKQDGWGFGIVSDAGHLYGVLAYHAVQALKWREPHKPAAEHAAHCARSEHHYGRISPSDVEKLGIVGLGPVPEAALGPPLDPEAVERDRRKAALLTPDLPRAFGWDAFDHAVWPGPKFMFAAPLGTPPAVEGPDQLPGFGWDENTEFGPLPPDRPATRAYYFVQMRARATE